MGLIKNFLNRLQQRPVTITMTASGRPLIQIVERHDVARSQGPGIRSCVECGTMWKSHLGTLIDSGEYARQQAFGDCKIYASWDETIGLTCRACDRSSCLEHLVEPQVAGVPQVYDYACPSCGERLSHA